ncbi:MAG: hypothetical protein ACOYML_08335 [Microthrixaceae bacterium]
MPTPAKPNKLKSALIAGGLTAGLIGGGAAGLMLGTSGISGAQDAPTTTVAPAAPAAPDGQNRPDPSARIGETLAPLVANGTITQAQADAVTQALVAAMPKGGPRGDHGGPGGEHGRRPGLAAAAKALNVTEDELRTALQGGKTLAQVAQEKGVDVQVVIDALVNEARTHFADEVKNGELTQEQADQRLAKVTERITDMVNNGGPKGGPGGERGGRPGGPCGDQQGAQQGGQQADPNAPQGN